MKKSGFVLLTYIFTVLLSLYFNIASAARDVYIVPDIGTFIYYVSLWDADNQFPVFIGENKYTEKFLKSYAKAKVTKPQSVSIGDINEQLVYKALYAAWGPEKLTDIKEEVTKDKLKERLKQLNRKPLGIVVTNTGDMEFAGGFALAAGHKQLLDFYKSEWRFNDSVELYKMSVTIKQKEKIRSDILQIVKAWGYEFKGLDDDIDYLTLALDIQPGTIGFNPSQSKETPGFSLDDAINRITEDGFPRDAEGKRFGKSNVYAYVGRLVEAEPGMSTYQAMCSLFCPIEKAFYFDWWPEGWGRACKDAVFIMRKKLDVTIYHQSGTVKANIDTWRLAMKKGNKNYDFIHVSATGNYDKWNKGTTEDIPDTKPVVVHFAQSTASRNPKNNSTIIGRWLRNGAYITYGAIAEPYAPSFNLPKDIAKSIIDGEPFGKAFENKKNLMDPFRMPWKLMYVGDPLRRLEPECKQTR